MTRRSVTERVAAVGDTWQESSCLWRGLYGLPLSEPQRTRRAELRGLLKTVGALVSMEEVFGAGLLARFNATSWGRFAQEGTELADRIIDTFTDAAVSASAVEVKEMHVKTDEPLKWTTKDGRTLRLSEMTKEHLQNAAAMLRRKGFCSVAEAELSWSALSMCQGEMASYYAEQACAELRPRRVLDELDAEIGRRA